jgi:outer membrane receptor protein involved in Fe transport
MIRQFIPSMSERAIARLTLIFAVALVAALSPLPACGQATATVNGTVRDSAGAVVVGAAVVLHNRDTNLDRAAATNDAGAYVMPDVQPGNYDLRVTKSGFGPVVKAEILLVVNQTATYDFALRAGAVNQVVEVQANPVALETSTAEVGVAVVKEQVNDLPLNGRNFTQILNLTPGVSTVNVSQNSATSGGVWSNPIGTFSYPSVNGQTNRSNLFLLDGVNNEGSFGSTYAVPPIVDDIQEFKVQTHNDDASFGGVMGGVVNVVTKSGTSRFHGSGWEFIRNKDLDSANYFFPIPQYQQNQFGATFGGPLPIPGEQKRTFFFLSYEGFRLHTAASNRYITPNTSALATVASGGDANFSSIVNQIYNPYNSGQPFLCSAPGVAEPGPIQAPGGTPCNVIPNNMIDQTMVTYAQTLFPAPNLNPASPTAFNGLDTTGTITRQDEGSGRLDHQFSNHDSVWARYSSFRQPVAGSGGFAGLLHDQVTDGYNVAVNYMHLFSGNMLAEFRFGRNNMNIDQGSGFANGGPSFGTQLFNSNFAGGFKSGVSMVPEVYIQGYIGTSNPSAHGAAQIDDTHASDIWEYGGDFTKTIGRHTFKAGADFASNNVNALYLNSSVDFLAANTAQPNPPQGAPPSGDGLASFLLGDPGEASRRNVVETTHAGWIDGFYAMDQWRVTSKLNVNFGFRYDITFMPIYGNSPNDNYYVGDMDFTNGTYILAHNAPSCLQTNAAPCIPNGVLPANVVLTPLGGGKIFHTDYNDFQPRVGLIYQILPNTVLRAGYGRFFDNWAAISQTSQNYEGTWPSLDQLGASNINPISSGAPAVTAENPLVQSSGPPVTGPTPFNQSTWFADPYLKRPYADQWNFGAQQQVTSKDVLTVNYVGSVGRRLDVGGAYNVAVAPGGNVGCPAFGTNPNDFNCGAPFPYIGATAYDRSQGKSTYNALQVSLNGRQQHGLTYLVSYTWSKSLDLGCTGWYGVEGCSIQNPYNLQADKGPSATDLPQIFSAAWVYTLPFGKGGRFSSDSSAVNALIGGWNLNGVLSLNSGQAFDIGTGLDQAQTGNYNYGNGYGYERANLIGNRYPTSKTTTEWINTASFQLPALDTFGDLGRNSLRSNWNRNLDISLFRQFPITERFRAEFRFEVFNATNTKVWAVPITDMDLPLFGQVTSTANVPRQLQFALKLYY